MRIRKQQLVLKVVVASSLIFAASIAHAGFAMYTDKWPDDASIVNERVTPPEPSVTKVPSEAAQAQCEVIKLSQNSPNRVPERNHLYVKFGGMFTTAEIRSITNLSQGNLGTAYLIQQSLTDNYFTWEAGIGSKLQNVRWELEYVYYKDLQYNPNPIFANNVERLMSSYTNITLWFNLIYDFDTINFVYFKPYVGAMLGLAWNRTRSTMYNGLGTGQEQTHSRYNPGWGVTVGARMPFSERWFAYVAYKYNNAGNMKWKDSTGVLQLKGTFVASGVSFGVQYLLG